MDSFLATCQTAFSDLDVAFRVCGDGVNVRAFGINWFMPLAEREDLLQDIRSAIYGEDEPRKRPSQFLVQYDDDSCAVLITLKKDTLILDASTAENVCKWLEAVI